jgi:hypothetical protein
VTEAHHDLMTSNAPPPLIHTSAIPGSTFTSSPISRASSFDVRPLLDAEPSLSSLPRNSTYVLTNPFGLNLGKQTGIHDADASDEEIDGAWIVFRRMWMSERCRMKRQRHRIDVKENTCRMYRVLLRSDEGDHLSLCHEQHVKHILSHRPGVRFMAETEKYQP